MDGMQCLHFCLTSLLKKLPTVCSKVISQGVPAFRSTFQFNNVNFALIGVSLLDERWFGYNKSTREAAFMDLSNTGRRRG